MQTFIYAQCPRENIANLLLLTYCLTESVPADFHINIVVVFIVYFYYFISLWSRASSLLLNKLLHINVGPQVPLTRCCVDQKNPFRCFYQAANPSAIIYNATRDFCCCGRSAANRKKGRSGGNVGNETSNEKPAASIYAISQNINTASVIGARTQTLFGRLY